VFRPGVSPVTIIITSEAEAAKIAAGNWNRILFIALFAVNHYKNDILIGEINEKKENYTE
jgi:hypothetical protein